MCIFSTPTREDSSSHEPGNDAGAAQQIGFNCNPRSACIGGQHVGFSKYPKNCCGAASKLLARYLVEVEGISPVEGVANGAREVPDPDEDADWTNPQAHFWLEVAGLIIDITADQFDDCTEPVIVTTEYSWHEQFRGQKRLAQAELTLNDFLSDKYARMIEVMTRKPA